MEDFEKYDAVFNGVDVKGELAKMALWLEVNPARRKKNVKRFIVNWLSKSHRELQKEKRDGQRRKPTTSEVVQSFLKHARQIHPN